MATDDAAADDDEEDDDDVDGDGDELAATLLQFCISNNSKLTPVHGVWPHGFKDGSDMALLSFCNTTTYKWHTSSETLDCAKRTTVDLLFATWHLHSMAPNSPTFVSAWQHAKGPLS